MQGDSLQGKIIKGIAGFYYVHASNYGIYECKAKGAFRKNNEKPLVGDDVKIIVLDEEKKLGNIEEILPRKNDLIRPAVANVDQALVIFAVDEPKPNFNLLDRFLLMMEQKAIPTVICFNKEDLVTSQKKQELQKIYENTGHTILFASARKDCGVDALRDCLLGKTTTVAGPSGVGKSSLINRMQTGVRMETGTVSEKIKRGKHTTRHSELIAVGEHSYILDTPGFSSLGIFDLEKEDVKWYYPEFDPYEGQCRFLGCNHMQEPSCAIKEAVKEGEISPIRYENYRLLYEECSKNKDYCSKTKHY